MNEDQAFGDRILEIIAVLLVGVTTLGTAWCGYQASQWSGIQNAESRVEAEHRIQATRQFGVAVQAINYDATVLGKYAQAVQSGDTALTQFYRQTLVRPELLPFLDEWVAQISAGQTPTPLAQNQQYLDGLDAGYQDQQQAADLAAAAARQAGDHASAYILTTIMLAAALFFAGVASSFRYRLGRTVLIVLALVTVGYAATRLVGQPIA